MLTASGVFYSLQVVCAAVGRFQVSFLESVGGLLECEECRQKGTHLLSRSCLWGPGLETGSEHMLLSVEGKHDAGQKFRTFLTREGNQIGL